VPLTVPKRGGVRRLPVVRQRNNSLVVGTVRKCFVRPASLAVGLARISNVLARLWECDRHYSEGRIISGMFPALVFTAQMTIASAYAQFPAPAVRTFEVASIKSCQDSDRGGGAPSPGRVNLNCVTAANLIRLAYLVFPTGQPNAPVSPTAFQQPISGGPAWMYTGRYRIDAKAEGPVNIEMMQGPMMQSLLEDRFKLKLHRETREIAVFELTIDKNGPKLHPAREGGCVAFDRNHPPPEPSPGEPGPVLCGFLRRSTNGGFDVPGVTIADLCRQLMAYVDGDIIDKTGIAGVFDVHLELTPADVGYSGATPDPTSTFTPGDGRAIAAAVQKLGLQMRPGKGSAQILVVDRLERPPEN
jgi:uncharacterized protein (TIGR03435 family)